jgi:AraC-like DNA-binding protein
MEYLRRVRVRRARSLLGDVDLSIKEVARRVGFDDPYHFSKVFHKVDGLPPTLYREALLAGTQRGGGGGDGDSRGSRTRRAGRGGRGGRSG